jgi:DHA1 family multidrug resistance protein-like MFS transporter
MDEKLSMGMGRLSPPMLPDSANYVVDFDGINDPAHPYNWKFTTK